MNADHGGVRERSGWDRTSMIRVRWAGGRIGRTPTVHCRYGLLYAQTGRQAVVPHPMPVTRDTVVTMLSHVISRRGLQRRRATK